MTNYSLSDTEVKSIQSERTEILGHDIFISRKHKNTIIIEMDSNHDKNDMILIRDRILQDQQIVKKIRQQYELRDNGKISEVTFFLNIGKIIGEFDSS